MRGIIGILVLALVFAAAPAQSAPDGRIARQQARAKIAICKTFGSYCAEALAVSWCESKWYVWAQNGDYKGLFQVSGHWRRTVPGWGAGAWAQARHALRVFKIDGSDWSAWSCRWAAG